MTIRVSARRTVRNGLPPAANARAENGVRFGHNNKCITRQSPVPAVTTFGKLTKQANATAAELMRIYNKVK